MALTLETVLHTANTIGTDQADAKKIFITEQGDISAKSGLGFFKRHFSPSARTEENRATIADFQDAISRNKAYKTCMQDQRLISFFSTKYTQGSPLTARDVQQVAGMLKAKKTNAVATQLVTSTTLNAQGGAAFALFCTRDGASRDLTSDDAIRNVLKEFYYAQDFSKTVAEDMLSSLSLPNQSNAVTLLRASSAWQDTVNNAFNKELNDITFSSIEEDLRANHRAEVLLLKALCPENDDKSNPFLTKLNAPQNPLRMPLFDETVKALRENHISETDGPTFIRYGVEQQYDMRTPELYKAAIIDYYVNCKTEAVFEELATSNGLPKMAGKALAHHPTFTSQVHNTLSNTFADPSSFNPQKADEVMRAAAASFLTEKNTAIRELMALAKPNSPVNPFLGKQALSLTEESICKMLNPLLVTPDLLSHLQDPLYPHLEMLKELEDFSLSINSCAPFYKEFGAQDIYELAQNSLRIALCMQEAGLKTEGAENSNALVKDLFESIRGKFLLIVPGIQSLYHNLEEHSISAASDSAYQSMSRVYLAISYVMDLANAAAENVKNSPALGELKFPDATILMPLDSISHAVYAFGVTRGVNLDAALTGTNASSLLYERVGLLTKEMNLPPLGPDNFDLTLLNTQIASAMQSSTPTPLSPEQAKDVVEQAIRNHLLELKSTLTHNEYLIPEDLTKEQVSRVILESPLRDPSLISTTLSEASSMKLYLHKLTTPGVDMGTMAECIMRLSKKHAAHTGSFKGLGAVQDQVHGGSKAAMTLTLDSLHLTTEQEKSFFKLVVGDVGEELKSGFVNMLTWYNSFNPEGADKAKVHDCITIVDNLRMILASRVGAEIPATTAPAKGIQSIPGALFAKLNSLLGDKYLDPQGYVALSQVMPKLKLNEWNALIPVMEMVSKSTFQPGDCTWAQKLVAANARELLNAIEHNHGKPLTPKHVWQVVIGDKSPRDLSVGTLGSRLQGHAVATLLKRALSINPNMAGNTSPETLAKFYLSNGIPFQALLKAYTPGGTLGLKDFRLESPSLPSLSDYTAGNAYGLTKDWPRRQPSTDGTASLMNIHTGPDSGFVVAHQPICDEDNKPDHPIFVKIMEQCRIICSNDLQFQRVMQSLSQASTVNLRMLAETLPGMSLSEHSHFDSTVTPQANGDVVVELANSKVDRPFGAHIQITVSKTGEATITDIGIELRG